MQALNRSAQSAVDDNGFEMIAQVLTAVERDRLIAALGEVSGAGRRGLLGDSAVREFAASSRLLDLIRPHLQGEPRPVRAIYFDKSPRANWLVAWHQDLTVALRERAEVGGFGPWSIKDGIVHVQPPIAMLEQMLTIRLHLDAADESNGALRVLKGSHCQGRLSVHEIQQWRETGKEVLCEAKAGDALLMRPLLLHASGRSTSERHRRVLHIEYAGFDLPAELDWNELS